MTIWNIITLISGCITLWAGGFITGCLFTAATALKRELQRRD